MKSIRDFLEGKIRRSEVEDTLRVEDGADDPQLGAHQGTLVGPRGHITFFERGLMFSSGERVVYDDLVRIALEPEAEGKRAVGLVAKDGHATRIDTSAIGGEIVHATLRWIGHTQLRRKLD